MIPRNGARVCRRLRAPFLLRLFMSFGEACSYTMRRMFHAVCARAPSPCTPWQLLTGRVHPGVPPSQRPVVRASPRVLLDIRSLTAAPAPQAFTPDASHPRALSCASARAMLRCGARLRMLFRGQGC